MQREFTLRSEHKNEMIDVTAQVAAVVADARLPEGACSLYVPHAPAAVVITDNDDPNVGPAILAGIKTAAVINVGTATLGALIGAGGYGQPILTGIRLDDVSLILEGAIPAALLALLVQGGFELVERFLVPHGIKGEYVP